MKADLATQFRIAGLVRSPDREGAIAHLDRDRGFAVVGRGSMGPADVIDPTIWVTEKLSLALSGSLDPSDSPLRRTLAALRSLHAELMARSDAGRPWVSVLVLLLQGEDAVAVSAGDCPCFRFRSGLLSKLGRTDVDLGPRAPRGALGSEPQVRIEVVPLRPQPGDLYILSSRALREGELAVLSRDLTLARDAAQLLRGGVEGSSDRGRIAIRVLEPSESESIAALAESRPLYSAPITTAAQETAPAEGGGVDFDSLGDWADALEIEPLRPAKEETEEEPARERMPGAERVPEPTPAQERSPAPEPASPSLAELGALPETGGYFAADLPAVTSDIDRESETEVQVLPERKGLGRNGADSAEASSAIEITTAPPYEGARSIEVPAPSSVEIPADEAEPPVEVQRPAASSSSGPASVEEGRPLYEPLALWAGGALAIVALALLVRSLLPGILGTTRTRPPATVGSASVTGLVDLFSDPPGATVRVDGVALEGKTPLTGVSLDAGAHRVELDWGPFGVWRDTIEVVPGSRLTVHPALFGAVSFRSSDPARVLDVYLDGVYAGTTPLTLGKVVVGRHLVRFGGPGLTASAQEVEILRDTPVELTGNAGPAPANGKLTVRTAILGDSGFEPGNGDPYWIDGVARGVTPATLELKPGTHSVRVARRGYPPQISVLDVKAGGEHFVTAEFGARSEEPLRFDPPAAFSISDPSPLTMALPASEWDPSMSLWLYASAPGGSFQAKRMTRLDEGTRTFAALLPPEVLRNSTRQVRFYFKATGAAGRELFSEIYTVPVRE